MTKLPQPLAITALGAISAVGSNAPQTCTSIRAGLIGASEHSYYVSITKDPGWDEEEPLIAASVPLVDPELDGSERLRELAIPALLELASQAGLKRGDLGESALLVALPSLDEDVQRWELPGNFVDRLCTDTGLGFKTVHENQSGRTGIFELLAEASRLLAANDHSYCWLLGVDSYLSEHRMTLWDQNWRLRSERNTDGFIPGEAAGALLVETLEHAHARSACTLATIEAMAFADETQPQTSQQASTGTGLCDVLAPVIPGKIVAVGVANNGNTNREFAVARYNTDGSLDSTFGVGGKVTTDFFGSYDLAYSVAIQNDGRIVVAGTARYSPVHGRFRRNE